MPVSLPIWVVYDHPSDHPDVWCARLFLNDMPTRQMFVAYDVWDLRAFFHEQGLRCFNRNEDDDPAIVETWL